MVPVFVGFSESNLRAQMPIRQLYPLIIDYTLTAETDENNVTISVDQRHISIAVGDGIAGKKTRKSKPTTIITS